MQVQPSCLLFLTMTVIAFFNIAKLKPERPHLELAALSKLPCISCKEITFGDIPNLQGKLVVAAHALGKLHGSDFEISLVCVVNKV